MNTKIKKIGLALGLILGLMTLAGCQSKTKDKNELQVGILQVAPHGSLDAARKGFEKALKSEIKKVNPDKKVVFNYLNAQGDQSNLKSMSDQLVQKKPDLLFAIGTPAAQALAKATKEIPVVVTAVTDLEGAGLVKTLKAPGTNVTGVSDAVPTSKQLKLLLSVTQNAETIGLLYNAGEANSVTQIQAAEKYLKTQKINVKKISVSSTNDVRSATESLVGKVEGIYIPTDNLMASAMTTVGKVATEAKIPVVAGSIEMMEDGGLTTYGIVYQNLGAQTAKMAKSILLDDKQPAKMAVETSNQLELAVNQKVSTALGIKKESIQQP